MGADEPGFAFPEIDISLGELGIARTQALHFPTLERQSGLETVFDEVLVARPPIDGDRVACGFLVFLFAHITVGRSPRLRRDYTGKALYGTGFCIRIAGFFAA